ncbi:hypothetical protein SELMODRAFT_430837 [Selaginella moellendorffii]|uniref:Uncharacterized protein n=1 Tax=Selaginella moellendorffii TaxID=88036 RepID=D8TAP1_SELML|nr:uncharacterized protein LOC9630197 [Selaginella moellendorffii]EFJ06264.1 hypothetical protein SELMODRAFT_430837 [Selaginella moellendorffii]|eukprot:XP_002992679.1 uncharacterized protein LOC9630197 [Selaginella moellendorffii]
MDDNRCLWKKDWPEESQLNVSYLLYSAMKDRDPEPVDQESLKKFCQAMERVTFASSDTLEDYIANIACLIEGKCHQRIGPEEKDYLKLVTEEILETMSSSPSQSQRREDHPTAAVALGEDEAARAASTSETTIPELDLTDIPDFVNSTANLDDIEMTLDSMPDDLHLLDDTNMI